MWHQGVEANPRGVGWQAVEICRRRNRYLENMCGYNRTTRPMVFSRPIPDETFGDPCFPIRQSSPFLDFGDSVPLVDCRYGRGHNYRNAPVRFRLLYCSKSNLMTMSIQNSVLHA